jgi:hypothetical protein
MARSAFSDPIRATPLLATEVWNDRFFNDYVSYPQGWPVSSRSNKSRRWEGAALFWNSMIKTFYGFLTAASQIGNWAFGLANLRGGGPARLLVRFLLDDLQRREVQCAAARELAG